MHSGRILRTEATGCSETSLNLYNT